MKVLRKLNFPITQLLKSNLTNLSFRFSLISSIPTNFYFTNKLSLSEHNKKNNENVEPEEMQESENLEDHEAMKSLLEETPEESRLKKLSFELVGISHSDEVLELYEREIEGKEVSSEELILILYFFCKLADNEIIKGSKQNHQKLLKVIRSLSELFKNENTKIETASSVLALCYSLFNLKSKFGIQIPLQLVDNFINLLMSNDMKDRFSNNLHDIPSVCFSLTNILEELKNDAINDKLGLSSELEIIQKIEELVIKLTTQYCKYEYIYNCNLC